jgi:hypothetical protein
MSKESRKTAGILLVIFPTVIYGGVTLLRLLIHPESGYMDNPLRQNLWRAGHAHAGVFLVLSLIILKYVDEANLSERIKKLVRSAAPVSAILLPAAYFLSVASPDATEPNSLIFLAYAAAVILTFGLITLGIGLLRKKID